MQKSAGMAVHAKSNRKHPVCWAGHSQFRLTSAPTKPQALSVRGSAVHAWDGTSCQRAPERQDPPTLPTPRKRSHTFATW